MYRIHTHWAMFIARNAVVKADNVPLKQRGSLHVAQKCSSIYYFGNLLLRTDIKTGNPSRSRMLNDDNVSSYRRLNCCWRNTIFRMNFGSLFYASKCSIIIHTKCANGPSQIIFNLVLPFQMKEYGGGSGWTRRKTDFCVIFAEPFLWVILL